MSHLEPSNGDDVDVGFDRKKYASANIDLSEFLIRVHRSEIGPDVSRVGIDFAIPDAPSMRVALGVYCNPGPVVVDVFAFHWAIDVFETRNFEKGFAVEVYLAKVLVWPFRCRGEKPVAEEYFFVRVEITEERVRNVNLPDAFALIFPRVNDLGAFHNRAAPLRCAKSDTSGIAKARIAGFDPFSVSAITDFDGVTSNSYSGSLANGAERLILGANAPGGGRSRNIESRHGENSLSS
ncbi:MAG: hypothetical protein E7A10_02225 [Dermabacter sp.]|nr:hypothetical protein [Dermabacter sp.]